MDQDPDEQMYNCLLSSLQIAKENKKSEAAANLHY